MHTASFGRLPSAICFHLSQRNFSPRCFPSINGCASVLQRGVPTDDETRFHVLQAFSKQVERKKTNTERKSKKGQRPPASRLGCVWRAALARAVLGPSGSSANTGCGVGRGCRVGLEACGGSFPRPHVQRQGRERGGPGSAAPPVALPL